LLVEGGGDDLPVEAMTLFKSWCKEYKPSEASPTILIIIWASEREPAKHLEDAAKWIKKDDTCRAELVPTVAEVLSNTETADALFAQITKAAGVFIAGGDQSRICDLFEKIPKIKEMLLAKYAEGCGFGGTSAGAAVMSETMLTGEGGSGGHYGDWDYLEPSKVETRKGLGLVTNIVVDQHFVRRQRMNRLLSVLCTPSTTEKFGLGVDEDVAVAISDNRFLTVYGRNDLVAVLFIRAGELEFKTKILKAGTGIQIDLDSL